MAKRRVFVAADFSAMESWLTAYHANDLVMKRELEDSITGRGPKPHALNAALVYQDLGVTPENCKDIKVILQGREVTSYYGGKRVSHLVNYGGEARKIADSLWVPIEFAEEAKRKLDEKYSATVQYRKDAVDEVFGRQEWRCTRCDYTQSEPGMCPRHVPTQAQRNLRLPRAKLQWVGWIQEPKYRLYTGFGRVRHYRGRRKECANAIAAQRPQGDGASVWYRTLHRLKGRFEVMPDGTRKPWPGPPVDWQVRVAAGTYDSFVLEAWEEHAEPVRQWLLWTMEQPWSQLDGLRLPAESSIGYNWGDKDMTCAMCAKMRCECGRNTPYNETGLADVEYEAFTATCPFT